jgi:hypothetical protein
VKANVQRPTLNMERSTSSDQVVDDLSLNVERGTLSVPVHDRPERSIGIFQLAR